MKLSSLALLSTFALACSGAAPADPGTGDAAAPADDGGTTPDSAAPVEAAAPADAAPPGCTYPNGPYGPGLGQTISPSFSWQGYAPNETTVSTLKSRDLFDCDGSKGIDAIVIDVSAGWCAACETQAHDEAQLTGTYDQLGVKAVTLLIMDAAENAATTDTALDWRTTYHLDDVGVYADPNFLLQPNEQTIGLPITLLVDPRTMKVVKKTEGYGSQYPIQVDPDVAALAKKNGG